jgi:hypothetical protein
VSRYFDKLQLLLYLPTLRISNFDNFNILFASVGDVKIEMVEVFSEVEDTVDVCVEADELSEILCYFYMVYSEQSKSSLIFRLSI